MVRIEDIAQAAVDGEALRVRSLTQDWRTQQSRIADEPPPTTADATVRAVAAALIELFALQRSEPSPAWSASIGPLEQPLFLVRHATSMPNLRKLCESESAEPLRRRRIYAPPDYLLVAKVVLD